MASDEGLGSRAVAEGIIQITLPMPFMLRSVHVYLIEGNDGWFMIDSGFPTHEAQDILQGELTRLIGGPDRVEAVVITHFHPDHSGLAGWLQDVGGAKVYIHRRDAPRLEMMTLEAGSGDLGDEADMFRRMAQTSGFSFESMRSEMFGVRHPIERPVLVDGGEVLVVGGRRLELVWTPGHTEGHLCAYDREASILFTGDHVLARITPHVGLYSSSLRNPLHEFEESLEIVRKLDPAMGLPAHEAIIVDPAARAQELAEHHRSRRDQVLEFTNHGAQTTAQVAAVLFRGREGGMHQYMAYSETAVHLEALVAEGLLVRESLAGDSVYRHA